MLLLDTAQSDVGADELAFGPMCAAALALVAQPGADGPLLRLAALANQGT